MDAPLPRGVLVAVEGIDGAGKTTQARRLKAALEGVGLGVVLTKEPTAGPWGQKLRDSAHAGRLDPTEELEAFLHDRREHVETVIAPALAAGKVVIVDRYYWSTAAYQGSRGARDPAQLLETNEEFAPIPDLVLLLEVEPDVGIQRIRTRESGNGNLFEREDELRAAAQIFTELDRSYVCRLDGTRPEDELAAEIAEALYFGPLFRALCFRAAELDQCEPALCVYRASGACRYPEIGRLAPVG